MTYIDTIYKRRNWLGIIVISTGTALTLLAPWVLTQFHWKLDFTETGQIGDTIGGTTAPIIGLTAAILVYLAFKAQLDANKLIQKYQQDEMLRNQIQGLIDKFEFSCENLKFDSLPKEKGLAASQKFFNILSIPTKEVLQTDSILEKNFAYPENHNIDDPDVFKLIQILKAGSFACYRIDEARLSGYLNEYYKFVLNNLFEAYFEKNIEPYLSNNRDSTNCIQCSQNHLPFPNNLIEEYLRFKDILAEINMKP